MTSRLKVLSALPGIFALAIAATFASPPSSGRTQKSAGDKPVVVPRASKPTLDGTIHDDEWNEGVTRSLTNGGSVRFQVHGDRLYVGVRGREAGWSQLVIWDGQRVRVLHASNALGQVAYDKKADDAWSLDGQFRWELSGAIEPGRLPRLLDDYLQQQGWTATNNNAGRPTDIEYEIDLAALKRPDSVRLVVVHSTNDVTTPLSVWPPNIKDGATNRDLMNGSPPAKAVFRPHEWGLLKLAAKTRDSTATSRPSPSTTE